MSVVIHDNSAAVRAAADRAKRAALEAIGMTAEGHAKEAITRAGRVDTGRLRNSIAHKETDDATYIGSNVEYAPYIEMGTGIYASDGSGRKDPWVYRDENGDYHFTRGVRPVHFLQDAATKHTAEYKQLAKDAYTNA